MPPKRWHFPRSWAIKRGEADSYVAYGIYYWAKSQYEKSIEQYTKALPLYEAGHNQKGMAKCYANLGMVKKEQGSYSMAMDYYFKSLQWYESLNDTLAEANLLNNIGVLMKEEGKYKDALHYYQRSVDLLEKINPLSYAGGLSNIGELYQIQGNSPKAIEYLTQALQIIESLNIPRGKAICFNDLGDAYRSQKAYDKATFYYQQALEISEKNEVHTSTLPALLGLGSIRLETGRQGEAMQFFEQAKERAQKYSMRELLVLAYKGLARASSRLGNYPRAFDYQSQQMALNDSLFNEESTRKIAHIQASYETEKKQAEIKLLKEEKTRDLLIRNLFGFGLAGSIVIGFLAFSRQRIKVRSEKELSEKNKQILITQQALTEAERANSQMIEEQLKVQLEARNKELTTQTLNIIQKNELMEEVRELLNDILQANTNTERASTVKYSRLIKLIDYSFTLDKDWEDFKRYFEQVHQDFFFRLKSKYPDLTAGELRLSALVKLNLNLKESATILGISPESVKTARHRLRKKLNLPEEQNLTDYLITA